MLEFANLRPAVVHREIWSKLLRLLVCLGHSSTVVLSLLFHGRRDAGRNQKFLKFIFVNSGVPNTYIMEPGAVIWT